jgi:proteasome accessory factor B
MEKASQTERLLNLVCVLLTSEIGMTKAELFQAVRGYQQKADGNLEALDKLFDRDKDLIREYGVQLVSNGNEKKHNVRYRIADGEFSWPKDLELTGRQLELLELAAMAWSKTSIKNFADFGLIKLRALGHNIDNSIIGLAPTITISDQNFEILSSAIVEKTAVIFEYLKLDAINPEQKTVLPLKIRNIEGEWVLLAKDAKNSKVKNYLLRRISSTVYSANEEIQISNAEIERAETDLEQYIQQNVAELWVREDSEAEFKYGKSGEITINYMDEELLSEDILDLASDVQVISPESLVKRVNDAIQRVVSEHA